VNCGITNAALLLPGTMLGTMIVHILEEKIMITLLISFLLLMYMCAI
jgi:hypothetical protein